VPVSNETRTLMALGGIEPMDIIVAATKNGAKLMSTDPDFGILKIGNSADLLVLSADPLEDITNATKMNYVVNRGHVFTHDELLAANFSTDWPKVE
jgi:imidazolonepropionase-like amidohydrolase